MESNIGKKKFNIPVGSVDIDEGYETSVLANYVVPPVMIRHTQNIVSEVDLLVDYVMEKEDEDWLKGNHRLQQDKEIVKNLTPEAFEAIINILEKHTGSSQESVVSLSIAEKVVSSNPKFNHWSNNLIHKILPEIYQYWNSKRNSNSKLYSSQGKALCRRYWIPTSSSDTNPYHTFRPRDRERYRLRKQHRRNDVEAFRKLQQLRREFAQARVLTQMVVERERLYEASATMDKLIFEQKLIDAGLKDVVEKTCSKIPNVPVDGFKYELLYSHLLTTMNINMEPEQYDIPLDSESTQIQANPALKARKRTVTPAVVPPKAGSTAAPIVNKNNINKRKRPSGQSQSATLTPVDEDKSMTFDELFKQYEALIATNGELDDTRKQLLKRFPLYDGCITVPTKSTVFPSFVDYSDIRRQEIIPTWASCGYGTAHFLNNYFDELLYRVDPESQDYIRPTGFKMRARVGRGGRMVLDRIPVYNDEDIKVYYASALPEKSSSVMEDPDAINVPFLPIPQPVAARTHAPRYGEALTNSSNVYTHSFYLKNELRISPSVYANSQSGLLNLTNGSSGMSYLKMKEHDLLHCEDDEVADIRLAPSSTKLSKLAADADISYQIQL